jgi:hypothetical protein
MPGLRRTRRGGTCPFATAGGGRRKSRRGGGKRRRRQSGGFGLDATVLSTALVPISLVLANQYWPGKISDTRVRGRKSRRRR